MPTLVYGQGSDVPVIVDPPLVDVEGKPLPGEYEAYKERLRAAQQSFEGQG